MLVPKSRTYEGFFVLQNKVFQEVFTRESANNIPVPETKCEGNFLEDVKFRSADVKNKI